MLLYVCTGNTTVTEVDTATDLILATIVVPPMVTRGGPLTCAVSPDGTRLAVADWNVSPGTVAFIDCVAQTTVASASVPDHPWGMVWTPDSQFVYVNCDTSVARVSRAGTVGPIITTSTTFAGLPKHGICLDLTGRLYAAYGWSLGSSGICEIVLGTSVVSIQNPSPAMAVPHEVCVSSDGTTVYATNGDAHVYPYQPGGFYGAPIPLPGGAHADGVCFDPNSLHVFVGGSSNAAYAIPHGGTAVDHTFGGFTAAMQCATEPSAGRVWFSQQNHSGLVTPIDTATMTVGTPVDVSIAGTHVAWGMDVSALGGTPSPQWSIGSLRLRP